MNEPEESFSICIFCEGMYLPEFSDANNPTQYCGWECEEEDNELEVA